MGWLRMSQRNTDIARATPYAAWQTFDRSERMVPGLVYAADVNIWPIAWRFSKSNRLVVEISGSEQKGMVTFAHPAAGPFASAGVPVPNGENRAILRAISADRAQRTSDQPMSIFRQRPRDQTGRSSFQG